MGDCIPSRMGLASRTCCSIHECWLLMVARNCRMSLVVSVFPAPDSPLQRGHAGTSVSRTTSFQHLSDPSHDRFLGRSEQGCSLPVQKSHCVLPDVPCLLCVSLLVCSSFLLDYAGMVVCGSFQGPWHSVQ